MIRRLTLRSSGRAKSGAPLNSKSLGDTLVDMRLPIRKLAIGLLLLAAVAGAVDRLSLWIWEFRVHRWFEVLKKETQLSNSERTALWRHGDWYTASLSLDPPPGDPRSNSVVPFTEIAFERPKGIRPSIVTIDGLGGVHLRYFPPRTVWTLAIEQLFAATGPNAVPVAFVRSYCIHIQWYGETPKSPRPAHALVTLEHGLTMAL